ncbi:MAG: hypothetical protein NTW96_02955 [Planctomycetia bacterium]|nr:hypothetical protein [Planctomycetia bacterium]
MSTGDQKETSETKLPGVALAAFDAAVQKLKTLRDDGKYTIMLCRTGVVRIVGDIEDFQEPYLEAIGREGKTQEVEEVLAEIRNFCQVTGFFKDVSAAAGFIVDHVYGDEVKKLSKSDKPTFRAQLKRKLELAGELLPPASKQRQRRLQTATTACLEDMDVEVIQERRDDYQGLKVEQPFLRLRLRYTDSRGAETFPWFFRGPWGSSPFTSSKSFELECDEVDIDVLLFRLREAKTLLSVAVDGSASAQ